MKFEIDQSLCTGCGLCINECPPGTIVKDEKTSLITIKQENCIECSHCGMICPTNAVKADGQELPGIPDGHELTDYEITDRLIRTKRSIRHYKSAPLVREDLQEILYTGSITATASNSRHVTPVVLQGGEVAAAAALIARELLKVISLFNNPLVRAMTSKTPMARYTGKERMDRNINVLKGTLKGKRDPLFFHAPTVVILTYPKKGKRFGRTDCSLAGAHMMLSAHARGIGSCMIGFAEAALWRKAARKQLGIPLNRKIGLIFTLGYTDKKYYRYPVRNSWEQAE